MLKAAEKVLNSLNEIQINQGQNIIHYTLRDQEKHIKMKHYPVGDRIDYESGAQYFYHCHRENYVSEEHGHFHCFMRYKHIPKSLKPTPMPDWDKYIDNPMTHLVCIAMNRSGQPIRLFNVNRWVTSEIVYPNSAMPKLINKYKFNKNDDPYWKQLDNFVEGLIRLFSPQIIWLAQQRDQNMLNHKANNPSINTYEDRDFEEICEISINLASQIEWLIKSE